MNDDIEAKIKKEAAEKVRKTCIQATRIGFRDASINGLYTDGAAEAAISAIQKLDLDDLLEDPSPKE